MSEVKDDSAVDCNGDGSPARRSSTTTIIQHVDYMLATS